MSDGVHPTTTAGGIVCGPGGVTNIAGFNLTRIGGAGSVGGGGVAHAFTNGALIDANVAESLKRLYLAGTMDRSQVLELLGMEGPDSNDPADLYDLAYDERQREKLEAERERIRKTGKFY